MRKNRTLLLLFPALLVLLALLALVGCKDFSFYGVLGDRIDDTPLQIAPPAASVEGGSTLDFTATGGTPPYAFSMVSGSGFFSDADTYNAATAGTDIVQVTDSKGRSSNATISVSSTGATLQIAPPSVSVLVGGSVTFYVSGGTPPYFYTITTNNSGASMIGAVYTAGPVGGGPADVVEVQDSTAIPATDTASVSALSVPVADVDYVVSATDFPANGAGGEAIPGGFDFTIQNNGSDNGVQPISWWVFISDNSTLGSGDALLSSGSTAALPAGGSTVPPIDLTGNWPAVGGARWLFVLVASGDDLNNANNASVGDAVTLTPPDIDYVLSGLTAGGTTAGGPLNGTFDLDNIGASNGTQPVSWTVYVSADASWDLSDSVVDAGSGAALDAGFGQPGIAFDGTWPATSGTYYLIARVYASDEPSPADTNGNTLASGAMAVAAPPIDYLITTVNNTGSTIADGSLSGTFQYRNNLAAAGSQIVHWIAYVSTDATWDAGDAVIDSGDAPALPGSTTSGAVLFGGTWPGGAGSRYLLAKVSSGDDTNSSNNTGASAAVAVTLPPIDYMVTTVNNTGLTVAGGVLNGSFQYRNNGTAAGSQIVHWIAYVSADAVLDTGVDPVVNSGDAPALPGATTSAAVPFAGSWPVGAGNRYLFVTVSAGDDANTGNNTNSSAAVAVTNPDINYTAGPVTNTGGLTAGSPLAGIFTLNNIGTAGGSQNVYWTAYVSANATLEGTDPVVDAGVTGALGAGGSLPGISFDGTWPALAGAYYLLVQVSAVDEPPGNTGNNLGASAQVSIAPPNVDYHLLAVNHLGGTTAGASFTANFTLHNMGTQAGQQPVHWIAYVSTDGTLSAGDLVVDSGDAGALAGGASQAGIAFDGTWPAVAGPYWLIVEVSAGDDNNAANDWLAMAGSVAVAPAPVPAPDYGGTVSTGAPTRAGGLFNATLTVANASAVGGASTVYWSVYASLGDTIVDGGDKLVGSGILAALGPLGNSGPLPITSNWPAATGDYYLVAQILADDETAPGDNAPFSTVVAVGVTDYSGVVAHTGGTTAGAAFTGTLAISNIGGAYARDGAEDLYWIVYASLGDAVASPDDTVVEQGLDLGGLGAGTTLGPFLIGGTWPTAAGNYFLVAAISAGDDANGANNDDATVGIVVGAVDYTGSVTPTAGTTANRPFTSSLTINNVGTRGGASSWTWTVYASLGNTSIDAADRVVGSATIAGGLPAGGTSGPLAFGGTWPTAPGNYYLVVEVSAADDYLTGNNGFANAIPVTVNPPNVDYTVLNVLYDPSAPSTIRPGGVVKGTFDYRNAGTDAGVQTVFWTAYASRNTTLDASDTWIASGNAGPLAGLTTSAAPVNFIGNWPLDYGSYYLLIMVSEIEDVNGANNRVASAATTSIGMFTGLLAENNHEPNNDYTNLLIVYDLGVSMDPGMSLYMEGTMTGPPTVDLDDVIGVKSGTVTTLTASMTWGASQDIALYIWQGPPTVGVKAVSITNATSLAISWAAVPGTQYWIDVTNTSSKNIGPYTLIITGN